MEEETNTESQKQQQIINQLLYQRGALSWNIEQLSLQLQEVNKKLQEVIHETKHKI